MTTIQQKLEGVSDAARIWIFQSSAALTEDQCLTIQKSLDLFLPQWTSHSRALLAQGAVLHDRFIVVALDEEASSGASGCSIDSMTHQIEAISRHLNINLQDRMTFYFKKDEGDILGIQMHGLSDAYKSGVVDDETLVFDNLVRTKGALAQRWLVPLKESWHHRFV